MGEKKSESILIRITEKEKEGFLDAADIAGIPLSAWVRERLRFAAIHELENARHQIPFIRHIPIGGINAAKSTN